MKIIELLIDELEEFMGFDAVALVNQPAHEGNFYSFNSEDIEDAVAFQIIKHELFKAIAEKFVQKLPYERQEDYIARCIPALINEGYDQDQATAICYSDWDSFDETQDPQELKIGDYQTRYYDICPGASELYNRIKNGEFDFPLDLGIRNARLQDVLFFLEKQAVTRNSASIEDVVMAKNLAAEIMTLAEAMALEDEHAYIQGHVNTIAKIAGVDPQQDFEIDVTSLPDYIDQLIKKEEQFESYTDYPESAVNAAKRALEWRDSHPDQDCGTRVGWARANQLANREPISEETIARMASFARHLQYEDVPYSEGCGGLMVDAWGGRAGIEWASNKLDNIREEQGKTRFSFSLQEDQQIVVGPLMIPNKLIFRVNENNEPYYVYFTESTIEKIARKMMEEKKLDSVNLEHNQDASIDGHLIETWIVEDALKDKQQIYGMEYPKGTWMGMYKVEDPMIWSKVKSGELKGFSIEGYFADRLVQN